MSAAPARCASVKRDACGRDGCELEVGRRCDHSDLGIRRGCKAEVPTGFRDGEAAFEGRGATRIRDLTRNPVYGTIVSIIATRFSRRVVAPNLNATSQDRRRLGSALSESARRAEAMQHMDGFRAVKLTAASKVKRGRMRMTQVGTKRGTKLGQMKENRLRGWSIKASRRVAGAVPALRCSGGMQQQALTRLFRETLARHAPASSYATHRARAVR